MSARLNSRELRTGVTLASVVSFRMLGLFMILPVFMLLSESIPGYTHARAGLAIGIYGLTQAVLQQPFGKLSDRFGRRPVMFIGLALFASGGAVAAMASSMTYLIIGRALQGCGAIAGAALAFAADHTRSSKRSVVMAIIGMAIGASFLLSMIIAVPLSTLLGLKGLFWLTAIFGVVGMALVFTLPSQRPEHEDVLQDEGQPGSVMPYALSVFLLHSAMTLLFVVLPGMLVKQFHFALQHHWQIYLPSMLGSALLVFPLLRHLSVQQKERGAVPLAFLVLGLSLGLMSISGNVVTVVIVALAFFLAFTLLEATMPSLVSRLAGSADRGHKMGLYTSFQFLGAFAGGALGGWLLGHSGPVVTLSIAGSVCAVWAVVMKLSLKPAENEKPA